jgi:hypothetical protein
VKIVSPRRTGGAPAAMAGSRGIAPPGARSCARNGGDAGPGERRPGATIAVTPLAIINRRDIMLCFPLGARGSAAIRRAISPLLGHWNGVILVESYPCWAAGRTTAFRLSKPGTRHSANDLLAAVRGLRRKARRNIAASGHDFHATPLSA